MYSIKSASSCVDVRACSWASCSWGRCETNGLVVYFVCLLQSCRRWKSSKIFKAYICQQILRKNGLEKSNSKRLSDATGKKLPCWPLLQWRSATAGPAGSDVFFAKLSNWNQRWFPGISIKLHPRCEVKKTWNKCHSWWLVSTHFKNMLVKLDHFPQNRDENKKIFETTT